MIRVAFRISLSGMGKVVLYGQLTRMLNMVINLLLKETVEEHLKKLYLWILCYFGPFLGLLIYIFDIFL